VPTSSSPPVMALNDLAVLIPDHADTSSLSQQAYYLLRDRIVTLQLPPGTLVNERELAQDSGLGRTPVRDALRRLADENLVEIYPRRGVYVGAIDAGDLRAISEFASNSRFVSHLAATRATAADYPAIDGLLSELDAVTDDTISAQLIHLDQRIHRLIYRAARNDYLRRNARPLLRARTAAVVPRARRVTNSLTRCVNTPTCSTQSDGRRGHVQTRSRVITSSSSSSRSANCCRRVPSRETCTPRRGAS
jgi:DNA-binding GntR family transcriptional regulator